MNQDSSQTQPAEISPNSIHSKVKLCKNIDESGKSGVRRINRARVDRRRNCSWNHAWGVRLCVKQECRVSLWNRDWNACINMLNLFMSDCDGLEHSKHMNKLKRSVRAR